MSDIYVKGWLPGTKKQKTDVHYRSLDGDGNFNWRFVFPFEYLPAEQVLVDKKKEHFWSLDETEERTQPIFTVQVWDNDFISADDFLGSLELNLNCMPKPAKTSKACKLTQLPDFNNQAKCVSLFEQKKLNGFWPVYETVQGQPQLQGKVEMEIEIVTAKEAEERPTASARDEPNMHPKLDPPKSSTRYIILLPFKSIQVVQAYHLAELQMAYHHCSANTFTYRHHCSLHLLFPERDLACYIQRLSQAVAPNTRLQASSLFVSLHRNVDTY
ncbi:hypothetical protein EB796_001115 [Bugula neritina]|uniref:C2 domain-containing protein n=1 Tax=Bugula neritina TaxID=10212 RepID=A0A7J7KR59_BUGNE|nr:hypothetical protein EB796_001115 [Bugula neritina]